MDKQPRCRHYDARRPEMKEGCSNCAKGIGIQCAEHLTLLEEYETSVKFAKFESLMRQKWGIRLD
ncbi:MAG: hypothetical protein P4L49_02695 [Desulfosporosinus sp.]|nr:hypothetical protein [Desulfosporosinus sp.]